MFFAETLEDASGAIRAMLPISELPAAAPEVESSPKRAVLSEFEVAISTMENRRSSNERSTPQWR
jgi:hypothetical protein